MINTHWHDDHVAGNQVYRDTFPAVRFIAHANTRTDLIERGRLTADSTLAAVRLDALRDEVAGTEKQMRVMFASFFRRPVVSRAYEEAKNGTLK